MEARSRLVTRPFGSLGVVLLLSVAVALALLLAATQLSVRSNARSSRPVGTTFVQHQQAPDAAERNDIYAQAIAAQQRSLTPDVADRDAELSYRIQLSRFNDQSPDAQERNVRLSAR